ETLTVLPCKSSAVLIGESLSTASRTEYGASAIAATASSGAPLTSSASSGPEPIAMSIESAASACCTRGPPPKSVTSTSMPCCLKMPASMPTCSGTNWKVPACGCPTRTIVAACAAPLASAKETASSAAAILCGIVSSQCVVGWQY